MKTGNSSSCIFVENNKKYLLKKFDKYREYCFFNEYFINKYLYHLDKKYVAQIFRVNKNSFEIYYEYFPQKENISIDYSLAYLDLIKSIHKRVEKNGNEFKLYAKESFRSIPQTLLNIDQRLQNIFKIIDSNNKSLLEHIIQLKEFLETIKKNIFGKIIYSGEKFSHADSGLHNCILNNLGELLLTDLEYAGLDSPIKQCADYILHPKNTYDALSNEVWLKYFVNYCIHEKDLKNLKFYFSMFALKWSIILLNEFFPRNWALRIHAYPLREQNHDKILNNQMEKSKIYLKAAKRIIDNEKHSNLFTRSEKLFISKPY